MTDTVRALIAAGAGKEARSNFEQFIWLLASDKPNNDILEYVVREGYWLHRLKEPDRADLVTAVESSDLDQLRILVKRSHQRANDLASAIRAGDLSETIRIIGSNTELMRGHGESELVTAIDAQKPEIVEWLLENGANPDAAVHPVIVGDVDDRTSSTPSIFDTIPFNNSPSTTALLVGFDRGGYQITADLVAASKEAYSNRSRTHSPLDEALFGYRRHADPSVIELAVSFGGAPPKQGLESDQFLSDLCFWTVRKDVSILRHFLDLGYQPRQIDEPLKEAQYPADDMAINNCIGSLEAVELLLLAGADPNQRDSIDQTLLSEALTGLHSADSSTRLIELLLNAGADPNVPVNSNLSLLDYALARTRSLPDPETRKKFESAARILKENGAVESKK